MFAILWGLSFVTFLPSNNTIPELGFVNPVIMLKRVVFPAPFGPMTPRISPCFISNDIPPKATSPPKCFQTSLIVKIRLVLITISPKAEEQSLSVYSSRAK